MRKSHIPSTLAMFAAMSLLPAHPGFAQTEPLPSPSVVDTPQGEYRPLTTQDGHVVKKVEPNSNVPPVSSSATSADIRFAPPRPVVEAAPPPAADYPPCTNGRTDACRNPDPSRELPYYPEDKAAG